MRLNKEKSYEQGVWYYTGYPLTDHHEFAGLPNMWRGVQTFIGLEYRPQFYINIYNRIRNLEFSGENDMPISIIQKEYIESTNKVVPSGRSFFDFNSVLADQESDFSLTDYIEYEIES
jgi:hypothetical protein